MAAIAEAPAPQVDHPEWRELMPVPAIESEREQAVKKIVELIHWSQLLEENLGYDSALAAVSREQKDDILATTSRDDNDSELASEAVARAYGLEAHSLGTKNSFVNQEELARAERLSKGLMTPEERARAQTKVEAHKAARRRA